jgi:hypothetical protein
MDTDLAALRLAIQKQIGDFTPSGLVEIDRYINWANHDVENESEWPELWDTEWLVTVAPEETGTIAITNGLKAVTGTGTTFPADSASLPRWLAKSYTDPPYEVGTYTSGTDIDLVEAWTEDTETASPFVLYGDRYSLGATVKKIRSMRMMVSGWTNPKSIMQAEFDDLVSLPMRTGYPERWAFDGYDASGYSVVKLSPVPDGVYRIRVRFMFETKPLTDPTHVPMLIESRRDLIFEKALWWAFRLRGDSGKAADQIGIYQRRLMQELSGGAASTPSVRMKRTDDTLDRRPMVTYRFPAE